MRAFTFDVAGRMIRDTIMTAPSTSAPTVTAEGEAYLSAPQRLQFVDIEPPVQGQAIEVAPGVRWARIPLPIDLNHINVWLIDYEDGCIVVDTGMASPLGEAAWEAIEREVFATTPLRAVFVTHIHPDHIGLARWLQQRHGVPVWMSKRTHEQVHAFMTSDASSGVAEAEQFFTAHGITDRSMLPSLSPTRFARMTSGLPEVSHHVADGDHLQWSAQSWTALETNGHAEGHLCLHAAASALLISGDQVLPTISSNIGFTWRSQDANPLHSFLTSLQRLHALPRDTLVLPSHGIPFRGLQSRIEDLSRHHLEQLDGVQRACESARTALEILPVMFRRKLHGMHFFLAMAEALAHLEYLVIAKRLRRLTDDAGVIRYSSV
jgi:glyoxylase-like metal-dependent hydrolase (beta-lactamase superfamily II)